MPTYQYECSGCGHALEISQSMTDKRLVKCPECKKMKLVRLIGAGAGIIFKGSGFYETDYKRKVPKKEADVQPCPAASKDSPSCGSCPNNKD